jgi:hypothetical protein
MSGKKQSVLVEAKSVRHSKHNYFRLPHDNKEISVCVTGYNYRKRSACGLIRSLSMHQPNKSKYSPRYRKHVFATGPKYNTANKSLNTPH